MTTSPTTHKNRMIRALRTAVTCDPSIKDFIVHQDGQMWVICSRGQLRLSEVLDSQDKDYAELTKEMNYDAILYFVVTELMGAEDEADANSNLEQLQKTLETADTYSDSIQLVWDAKIRIILFFQSRSRLGLVGRVTSLLMPPLRDIGLPPKAISAIKSNNRGLILITGPLSSGKTSTAQAILNDRNASTSGHIMTVEDPIETSMVSDRCLITTKEVGIDTATYYDGVRDALRQAVNYLFIGELRDADTIKTAIAASGSGMLVVATLHADTCAGGLSRMMSFLGTEAPGYWKVLSTSMICVIRQALLPQAQGNGWIVVADALINSTANVGQLLATGNTIGIEAITKGPSKDDWYSMNDNLSKLVGSGKVTVESARRLSTDPKGL